MNQFQPFKFLSIEEFLNSVAAYELPLVHELRKLIRATLPNCTERLAYNVPYFYGRQRICFIWPSSIPWGNVKKNGVNLGFCKGNLLYDPDNYLDKDGRKQVFIKTFFSVNEIKLEQNRVKSFLIQAEEIDVKT